MPCNHSSYNSKFKVYTEKSDVLGAKKSLSAGIVMEMVKDLPNKKKLYGIHGYFCNHDMFKI